MSRTEPHSGQHHKRLAWFTGAALGIAAVAGLASVLLPRNESLLDRLTAPDVDGDWQFTGQPVRYMLSIRNGKVVGGFDGCNAWGFSDTLGENGQRMVVSDAQGCDPKPFDETYRLFAFGEPTFTLVGDTLAAGVRGHRASLVRAKP